MAVGCAQGAGHCVERSGAGSPAAYDAIIAKHARANGVPESLVRRIIVRESRYNPTARNGGHYGMMQIKPATAKSMGYQGDAAGLFDADTNLAYGVRYLAGAYKVAGGNEDRAVGLYARGYYYDAKRKGLLAAVGLGRDGKFTPASSTPPSTNSFELASADPSAKIRQLEVVTRNAPAQAATNAVPLPPARDGAAATAPQPAPKAAFALFGRAAPAQPSEPAPIVVATASSAIVPLPPVRGVAPVAARSPAVAPAALRPSLGAPAQAGQAVASADLAVPLPPSRDAVAKPLPSREATMVAVAKPRVIAATADPVLASAGPVMPIRPRAPAAPQPPASPSLAYASAQSPALEGVPLPSTRDVTGSIGGRRTTAP